MGVTSDPSTVPSCTGSIVDCVCDPSFISTLPCLFKSTGQAVAAITQSNNQVQISKNNAAANVAVAQVKAQSSSSMYMLLAIGVGAAIFLAFRH